MAAIIMAVNKNRKQGVDPRVTSSETFVTSTFIMRSLSDPTKAEDKMAKFQRLVREKLVYRKLKMNRFRLAERLNFESATVLGLFRFFNQLCVFALFVAALSFSSNQEAKRGILTTLDGEFEFDTISDVSRRDEFRSETMSGLSAKSKEFFVLSNKYFDDKGQGSTQLIGAIRDFTGPMLSAPIALPALEFSFTAWVKIVPKYVQG